LGSLGSGNFRDDQHVESGRWPKRHRRDGFARGESFDDAPRQPRGRFRRIRFTTTGTNFTKVAFSQTILDGSMRVDPTLVDTGFTAGAAVQVQLGDIIVNGDRELRIFDASNLTTAVDNVSFNAIRGEANSILRLSSSNTTPANNMLVTDQSSTMLGSIMLTNANGAGAWTLGTSGGLGTRGIVTSGIRLDIPMTTTLSAKDNLYFLTGSILSSAGGTGLGQLVANGSSTGPRATFDPGVVLLSTGATFNSSSIPVMAGVPAYSELRFGANISTAPGTDDAVTGLTLGGARGIGIVANDGAARTLSSGNIAVAGPFALTSRNIAGGDALVLGGTVAGNRVLNFVADPDLPAGYKGRATTNITTAFAATFKLGSSAAGGVAGDLSGLGAIYITGGQTNQPATLGGQSSSSLGGTGLTKPDLVALYGANNTVNTIDPGPANPIASGTGAAGNPSPISGNAFFNANGRLLLNDAVNVTNVSAGSWTFRPGSIIEVTNATAVSSVPASVTIDPGTILRMGVDSIANFASLKTDASMLVITGNRTQNTAMTLNRDPSVAWSGMISASAIGTLSNSAGVTIGANGGTFGAASGQTLTYGGTLTTGGNPLQIGSPVLVNAALQTGGYTYTGTSNYGTSTITTLTGGGNFTTTSASLTANSNNITADGGVVISGTGQITTIGNLISTGLVRLSPSTGAGSSLTAASFTRQNRGVLALTTTAAQLGLNEKVFLTAPPTAAVGGTLGTADAFVVPSVVSANDGKFVNYNANGFVAQDGVAYASATATQVANVTASQATTSGDSKGALVLNNAAAAIVLSGTNALTINSGGVISWATTAGHTISAPLNMNGQEAVFFVSGPPGGNTLTVPVKFKVPAFTAVVLIEEFWLLVKVCVPEPVLTMFVDELIRPSKT
jgi:hypothetical protein